MSRPVRIKNGRLTRDREERIRRDAEELDDEAYSGAWMTHSSYQTWELLDEIEALRLEMLAVLWMTDSEDDDEDDDDD